MQITYQNRHYRLDLPIDVSLPLEASPYNPVAWYQDPPRIEPVRMGDWVGKVAQGSSTNFNNIFFNPHAHATHTECLGHITRDFYSIHEALQRFFFSAYVVSVTPTPIGVDQVVQAGDWMDMIEKERPEALVLRTLPNLESKRHAQYSHTNPPYLDVAMVQQLVAWNVQHLLVDLPSVDRESDGGALAAHKAFWNMANVQEIKSEARKEATITELIFVPDHVLDGRYLLNLQVAHMVNDAAPSRPVLYPLCDLD